MTERHITQLLDRLQEGDADAMDRVFSLLYDELQVLARRQRQRWEGDHTMNTTALVHEAYIRLVPGKEARWQDRGHFFSVNKQLKELEATRQKLVEQLELLLPEAQRSEQLRALLTELAE